MPVTQPLKQVKSYVRRSGRFTPAQQDSLVDLKARYALDLEADIGKDQYTVLEIGFGNGSALLEYARRHPDWLIIGAEVYERGILQCLMQAASASLNNIRIVTGDVSEWIASTLPEKCLDRVHIFFPDPWPKKRHYKRRLIQTAFLDRVYPRLKDTGQLHLATDWSHYAEHMLSVLEAHVGFKKIACHSDTAPWSSRGERPHTKYEKRATRLGHTVFDLQFKKLSGWHASL